MFVDREDVRERFNQVYPAFLKAAAVFGTLSSMQGIPEYRALTELGEDAITPILDVLSNQREAASPLLFVLFELTRRNGIVQPELHLFDENVSVTTVIAAWIQWGIESGRIQDSDMIHY